MKLSIIIPTHKRLSSLLNLLESLKACFCETKISFHFETLVIFNLNDPKAKLKVEALYQKSLNLSVFSVGKLGVNFARNLGIKESCGDLLLFLDDDCLIETPQYFQNIKQYFNDERLQIFGGGYLPPKNATTLQKAYHVISEGWQSVSQGTSERPSLLGGNLLVRASVFKNHILFNEDIDFGSSETEFLFQQKQAGTNIDLVTDIDVIHNPRLRLSHFIYKAHKQSFYSRKYGLKNQNSQTSLHYYNPSFVHALKHSFSFNEFNKILALVMLFQDIFTLNNAPSLFKSYLIYLKNYLRLTFFDGPKWNRYVFKTFKSYSKSA